MNHARSESQSSGPSSPPSTQILEGAGVAPGIAIGTGYRYVNVNPDVERTHVPAKEVENELTLLEEAFEQAQADLEDVRSAAQNQLDPGSAAIFEAREMMLRDQEMLQAVRRRIRDEHESAAQSLSTVLRNHRRRLQNSDDEYLRDRARDLAELENRLLRILDQGHVAASVESNSIIVADRLTATDLLRFQERGIKGCAIVRGGRTSHVSIVARALDIPAVVGVNGAIDAISDHDQLIIDGLQGRLIARPNPDMLGSYRRRRLQHQPAADVENWSSDQITKTTDGHRVSLRATVDSVETLKTLDDSGAEGIGLMRTEMLFLGRAVDALTENDQWEVYRQVAEKTADHGATIRLLDLGGDKLLPSPQGEDNPFLGWRGIRVLLDRREELLRPQVRALLRASAHGSLRVLLPMVTRISEVHRVRSVFEEEAQRLASDGVDHDSSVPIGIMVEVPTTALQARPFAEVADFFSIGTNDLAQYVLAVDRGNPSVASHFDALHPSVLELVRQTVAAGQSTGTPVAVCGEVVSDILAIPILVGLGLNELSLPPSYLPTARKIILDIAHADASVLADEACATPDAENVRQLARDWIHRHVDDERVTGALSLSNGTDSDTVE